MQDLMFYGVIGFIPALILIDLIGSALKFIFGCIILILLSTFIGFILVGVANVLFR